MSEADEIRKLTDYFRTLGASNPEQWAESEIKEGIPQYARFVFLKTAWNAVISEGNDTWIDNAIKQSEREPNDPCSGAGVALKRMLAAGISRQDITSLVRVMQYETLFALCYQLDDSSVAEYPAETLPQVHWALMQVTEEGEHVGEIGGLHESVLELDPTEREMRPKSQT
jgi:hypothetical protein